MRAYFRVLIWITKIIRSDDACVLDFLMRPGLNFVGFLYISGRFDL